MSTILIEVRRAKPSDASAIAATHDEAWRGAYQGVIPGRNSTSSSTGAGRSGGTAPCARAAASRCLRSAIASPVTPITVATARAACYYDGEIYELYLRPEFQGLGFGRKLFTAARRDLLQSGLQSMVVWALSDNEPAVEFYRALGGKAVARSSERFGTRVLDKVAFAWNS